MSSDAVAGLSIYPHHIYPPPQPPPRNKNPSDHAESEAEGEL